MDFYRITLKSENEGSRSFVFGAEDMLDEIPSAYKNIDVVMENQKDLVEVVHVLRQVLNVKGA